MDDLISIITPVYNGEAYIEATIQSVLAQTYTNWEMLIVDDLSTDHTAQIIQKYVEQDSRIRFFVLTSKGGASMARNKAISEAKGSYIAFLDADDLWKSEKLEKQLCYMKAHDIDFCYHNYSLIDEAGKPCNIQRIAPAKITYRRTLLGCSIGCLSVMYAVKNIGLVQTKRIDKRNDDALWITILKRCRFGYLLDEDLAYYRVGSSSLSSGSKVKLLKYHFRLYRDIAEFDIFRSLFYTGTNIAVYFINKRNREIDLTNQQIVDKQ